MFSNIIFATINFLRWLRLSRPALSSLLSNSGLDGRGLSVCWNPDCRCLLPKSRRLPFSGFLPLDVSSPSVGDIFRSGRCSEPLQRTHLQRPLLKVSPIDGNETSRGRNPENGRRRDFGRRRHRQSGFQHTDRPRPSSPELLNKDHNAGRESLSHLSP